MFNEETRRANLVEQCFHREQEVEQYQVNINNYRLMIDASPKGEWPATLVTYKSVKVSDLPLELPQEMVEEIIVYQQRDRLRMLVRTEMEQQRMARLVLDAMKKQIGPDYSSLMALRAVQPEGVT